MNVEEEALQVVNRAQHEFDLRCEAMNRAGDVYLDALNAHERNLADPEVMVARKAFKEARGDAWQALFALLDACVAWEKACREARGGEQCESGSM